MSESRQSPQANTFDMQVDTAMNQAEDVADVESGAGAGIMHVGNSMDDENLLSSNPEDDEKMLIIESNESAPDTRLAHGEYEKVVGGAEGLRDASMIRTASQEQLRSNDPQGLHGAASSQCPFTPGQVERLCDLKDTIADLAEQIRTEIQNRYEPVDAIANLNLHLDAHHNEVWQMLNTPLKWLRRPMAQDNRVDLSGNDPSVGPRDQEMELDASQPGQQIDPRQEGVEEMDEEAGNRTCKIDFYMRVLAPISEQMLNERSVQNPRYMIEIMSFFSIIITKYMIRDPCCPDLLEVAGHIFNWDKSLHTDVLSKYRSDELSCFEQANSQTAKRLDREQEWRYNQLKVGDDVDVLKRVRLRNTNISGWVRGKIVFRGETEDDAIEGEERERVEVVHVKILEDAAGEVLALPIGASRIAPPKTYTNDWDWRYQLEQGDIVDCMDNERDWYKSTILQTRWTKNCEGDDVKEALIAFRIYDEEGSKLDDDDRKFFGWSEKYDEWIPVTSIFIQRYKSMHQQYIKVEISNREYCRQLLDFEDRSDLISANSSPAYFVARRNGYFNGSHIIEDSLNRFGYAGGFYRILEHLQSASRGEVQVSVQSLFRMMYFLRGTMPLWHRQFACWYVDRVNAALLATLSYVNQDATEQNKNELVLGPVQLDCFDSKMLADMVNQLVDPIWKRYNTLEMSNKILSYYQLEIGAALLILTNLQRRIQGIKYINEAIRAVRAPYGAHRLMTVKELIQVIRRLNIVEQVFGNRTHFQLIHRAQELIKLLFNEKYILESEIDMIWDTCRKQGEQIKLEVYNIILDVLRPAYNSLRDQTKAYFITKLDNIEPRELIDKDIDLLHELGKKVGMGAARKPEDFVLKAVKFMWNIATLQKDYPIELIKPARKSFAEMTSMWDDALKEPYIEEAIENIAQDKLPLQSLKLCAKMIERWTQSPYPANSKKTRQQYTQELVEERDFIGLIIKDLDRYIEFSNQCFKNGELTVKNQKTHDLGSNHPFPHEKNIRSRLNRIQLILAWSKTQLTEEQIEKIWDILVTKSAMREHDQNEFFLWFKNIFRVRYQKKLMAEEVMLAFFRKKIAVGDLSMLKSLKAVGLECIVKLFVLANELQRNVLDLDPNQSGYHARANHGQHEGYYNQGPSSYVYGYNAGSYSGSGQSGANKANQFRVYILPQQLEGIKLLWQMMEANDVGNLALFDSVRSTLVNIYTNLSTRLDKERDAISSSFIEECMNCLKSINENKVINRSDQAKKKSLEFICTTMKKFLECTETNGLAQFRSHRQLEDTPFIERLTFENKTPLRKCLDANYVQLNTFGSLSVWELKVLIAQYTNQSPINILLKRTDPKKDNIKESDNCKLLYELGLESNEILQIQKLKQPDPIEIPLLDKNEKIVPELKDIIGEWFYEYSVEVDRDAMFEEARQEEEKQASKSEEEGVQQMNPMRRKDPPLSELLKLDLPPVFRAMDIPQCCRFVSRITKHNNIEANDPRVVKLYDGYSKKVGRNYVLLQELVDFYEEQSKHKSEAVRQNLANADIQTDYTRHVDVSNVNLKTDPRLCADEADLPRSKLSNNDALFNQLLELAQQSQGDESDGIWQFIMSVPTNRTLLRQILSLEKFDELLTIDQNSDQITNQGEQMSDLSTHSDLNVYKILYVLQVLRSLINEYRQQSVPNIAVFKESPEGDAAGGVVEGNRGTRGQGVKANATGKPNDMDAEYSWEQRSDSDYADQAIDANQTINTPEKKGEHKSIAEEEPDKLVSEENDQANWQTGPIGPQLPKTGLHSMSAANADIPVAPHSAAAAIGPPRASNTVTTRYNPFRSLAEFVGSKIVLPLTAGLGAMDEETVLRKKWLPQFLAANGLNKLIELLRKLYRIQASIEESKRQQLLASIRPHLAGTAPPKILINERILKRCLREVMECVRILLISQMCAVTKDQDMALSLSRKLSSTTKQVSDVEMVSREARSEGQSPSPGSTAKQEAADNQIGSAPTNEHTPMRATNKVTGKVYESRKPKLLQEKENTEEEMKPLIELIKNTPELQIDFTMALELESFQEEIVGVIRAFMDKRDIKAEDSEIVKQGLSVWLSCLASDPKLLNRVYGCVESEMDLELHKKGPIAYFMDIFISSGLVSSEERLREAFMSAIRFITQSIRSKELTRPPLHFFLKLLISKLDLVAKKQITKETRHYFMVVREALLLYFEEKTRAQSSPLSDALAPESTQIFDEKQIIDNMFTRLFAYETTERRNWVMEDFTLIGFLDIISIILSNCPDLLSSSQLEQLAINLLQRCLFCMDFKAIEENITAKTDLEPYEKLHINKCQTKESTRACFDLLLTMLRINPNKELIFQILRDYWSTKIFQVDKPARPGFSPMSLGRSISGYCGLLNLGAVCYMNSMNQQFFNVPTLRYCLMAAQDEAEKNLVEFDGEDIDDNVLHQMQNMFGFLQLSDRQCRNPKNFCYSFKAPGGVPTNVREQKDAQEYLNVLFDRLESLLKPTSQKYLLQNVFGGKTCSIMRCKNCGNLRKNSEAFFNLSLEVKNQKDIYDGLQKIIKGENISDYQCEACNKRVELEKKVTIDKLPNFLIIHLQRIIFDFDTMRNQKLNDRVEFPEQLCLKEYMTDYVIKKDKLLEEKQKKQREADEIADLKKQNSASKEENSKQAEEEEPRVVVDSAEGRNEENEMIDDDMAKKSEPGEGSPKKKANEAGDGPAEAEADNDEYEYRLVGVVCHMGSADAGHYLSFINVEKENEQGRLGRHQGAPTRQEFFQSDKQKWYEFNDNTVSSFKVSQLENTCFGGAGNNQNAYMLFYEKRLKHEMKVVIPKEVMDESLARDGTAMTRQELSKQYHLFEVLPDLLDSIQQHQQNEGDRQQADEKTSSAVSKASQEAGSPTRPQKKKRFYYDEEKDEHIALVDFADARKFVPNEIYKQVHEDNLKFLCEKQVFSEAFFNATLSLCESSIQVLQAQGEGAQETPQFELVFRILDRMLFDVLANASPAYNSSIKGMTDLMIVMLAKSEAACRHLILTRVFVSQDKLLKDERNFFETLATHQHQEVREMASTILLYLLGRLVDRGLEGDLNHASDIISRVLEQLYEECQKHWMRLDTYLTFIYQLLKSSPVFLRMLIEKQIVSRLVNLLVKYNQNTMAYATVNPPLEKLVLSICFVCRSMPCIVDPYDRDNFQESTVERENPCQAVMDERGPTKAHLDLKKQYGEDFKPEEAREWLILPGECQKALFLKSKARKAFHENIIKLNFDVVEYAEFLAHLCHQNKEHSKQIAKFILKGIHQGAPDELGPILHIMKKYLSIEDDLKELRCEWIFGIASLIVKQVHNYQMYSSVPKLGVAYADSVSSVICKYFSPVFKPSTAYYGRKECAMQALLSNRKNQSKAVLYSLKSILETIVDEGQWQILDYLKTMDPPMYQHARYWDWIKPWVQAEVKSNTAHQYSPAFRADLELSLEVLSLIEKTEEQDRERRGLEPQAEEENATVIEYPENDGGPKPYLLWDLQSSEKLEAKEDPHKKVTVVLHAINCSVSQSFPTGDNNLALLDTFSTYQSIQGGRSIRPGLAAASQGMRGHQHNIRRRGGFGRGSRSHTQQQKSKGTASNNQGNGRRRNKNSDDKQGRSGQANEEAMADHDEAEADSEAPSSEDDNQGAQISSSTVGAVGEARRSKNVRFADQRESSNHSIDPNSPMQGQGQGGGWQDGEVPEFEVEESVGMMGAEMAGARDSDFPSLPQGESFGGPAVHSSESNEQRDIEEPHNSAVPGAAVPSTLFEVDDQLPGESVQIQIDEPESPAERPGASRAEPTPQDGGSPKQVPGPKESGPKDTSQRDSHHQYDTAAGMDLNVFGSDDDVQLVGRPDADEQHDADDGDDEDEERIHDARQTGSYPPRSDARSRGANMEAGRDHMRAQTHSGAHAGMGAVDREEDIESEDGDDRDDDAGDLPSMGNNAPEACERYLSQCVLLFKVETNSAGPQTIQLTVRPRRDEYGNPAPLNFKCPQSSIPCEVYSSSGATVLTLTKLDPRLDWWGDFEWFFEVVHKQNAYQMQNWQYNPHNDGYMNHADGFNGDYSSGLHGDGAGGSTGGINHDNDYGVHQDSGGGDSKSCPTCTFLNPPDRYHCEICNSRL